MEWPSKVCNNLLVATSKILTEPSCAPLAKKRPHGLYTAVVVVVKVIEKINNIIINLKIKNN